MCACAIMSTPDSCGRKCPRRRRTSAVGNKSPNPDPCIKLIHLTLRNTKGGSVRVTPAHTLLNVTHTQKVTRPPGDLPTQIPHPVIYGSLLYTCLECVPPSPLACSMGPLENTHGRPFPILRPSAGNFFPPVYHCIAYERTFRYVHL